VLEQRILGRAKYSGRADDNLEAMRKRFDTFKTETLPSVELFKSKGKCIEIDTSQDRETVYALLREQLAEHTDPELMAQPLTRAGGDPSRAEALSSASSR
jgi:UMP-CMP kinase